MARTRKSKTVNSENKLLVTGARLAEMQTELDERVNVTRPEIALEISTARDLGDLSENQAYTEAMNRKEANEARIEELEYLISIAQVVERDGSHQVSIGDTVQIKRLSDGISRTIQVVGKEETQEADSLSGKVSVDSPIGKAVFGAMPGDKVKVKLPAGEIEYQVVKVG